MWRKILKKEVYGGAGIFLLSSIEPQQHERREGGRGDWGGGCDSLVWLIFLRSSQNENVKKHKKYDDISIYLLPSYSISFFW
jgi:hypothetical protein